MDKYRVCCFFTRKFKVKEADPPSDVKDAFRKYSDGGMHMTVDQLRRFINECQDGINGVDVSVSEAEGIVEQVLHKRHPITSKIHRKLLNLEDFHHYLFNSELNPPIRFQVHQDMNAPLSHYFIYTGHNSYLTGNQLSSDCSDIPIINALKRGVRGIELDLWPNSSKDDVDVVHGGTMTKPVELINCLKSIKKHAFEASPYPVIITLEDHLKSDLQAKVAQMITETFGEMLFFPKSGKLKELPTPESLKHKILISTKPPKEYLEATEDNHTESQSAKDPSDVDVWGEEPSTIMSYKDKNNKFKCDESDPDTKDSEDQVTKSDSCPAYKSLIAIHAGKPKGGIEEALKVEKDKVRRLSLAEQKLEKATKSHQQHLVRFTQWNILRIYPKGTRITSSNYNPLIGWLHGAQMIAFNMQGYGRSLWLMHGMFRANGGCGYVKKPDFLMRNEPNYEVFNPKAKLPVKTNTLKGYSRLFRFMRGMFVANGGNVNIKEQNIQIKNGPNNEVFDPKAELPVKTTLKVKIYMGDGWHLDFKQDHFDAFSPPDFYTRVGISGAPADEIMKKTNTIEDNWTPVWDKEFIFPLTLPEIALLRIEVHEYDMSQKDDFGGQTCLPVSELRPGIRAVSLCDREGKPYSAARLLMGFEFVSNVS